VTYLSNWIYLNQLIIIDGTPLFHAYQYLIAASKQCSLAITFKSNKSLSEKANALPPLPPTRCHGLWPHLPEHGG
jgi:hypothetical protein